MSEEQKAADKLTAHQAMRSLQVLFKQHEQHVSQYELLRQSMDQGVDNPFFIERLQSCMDGLTGTFKEYNESYKTFFTLAADDRFDKQHQKLAEVVKVIEDNILKYICQLLPQEQAAKQEPKVAGQVSSKNAALYKPFQLMHDTPMSEYRQWCLRYQTYYSTLDMANHAANNQKALLMSCLDTVLGEIVMNSNATCTYANDNRQTWLTVLEKYFESTYPMHARISKLIALQPTPGQTTSGFFREFNKLVKDANAFTCTIDMLITNIMISKCPDPVLRKELLRRPIGYDAAIALGMESDAADVSSNLHHQIPPSSQVSAVRPSPAKSTPAKKQGATSSGSKKRCSRCGFGNHADEDCFTLKKPCPTCNKLGHIKSKCPQKSAKSSSAAQAQTSIVSNSAGSMATPTVHL